MKKTYLPLRFLTPSHDSKGFRWILPLFLLLVLTGLWATDLWAQEASTKSANPFFRDQKLNLNVRTYYLYKDKYDDSKSEAWALGGSLTYKSGYLFDVFAFGAAVYTSQPLYTPDDRDGTLLLKSGQHSYDVLGQLYGEFKIIPDNYVRLFRQEYNSAYINKNDNRMTPNTFEGYSFFGSYGGKDGAPKLNYGAGYVNKIKERNSDEFVSMAKDAGAKVDRGVAMAELNFTQGPISVGASNYYSEDILNIFYTEGKAVILPPKNLGLQVAAQYTDERSVGDDLLKGYDFSTSQFGVKGELSYGKWILTLAYTMTDEGADMQNPWSSCPGYTSVQVQDFNRAGEQAFLGKIFYDFSDLVLPGVTAYGLWVHGWNRVDPTSPTKNPYKYQEDEYNFDLQWRPQIEVLKGFSFRTRYALIDQRDGGSSSQSDFRIIVNYDIPLL